MSFSAVAVFIVALIAFLLLPGFGTTEFFIIPLDVRARLRVRFGGECQTEAPRRCDYTKPDMKSSTHIKRMMKNSVVPKPGSAGTR